MWPGWGVRIAYIHEILIAILKWTRDDTKIMISLYNRESAALKSQVTSVGLAHAHPIMYNRVLHSQHMYVHCVYVPEHIAMNGHMLCSICAAIFSYNRTWPYSEECKFP